MKKWCVLMVFTIAFLQAFTQTERFIDSILNNRILRVPEYTQPVTSNYSLIFKMPFGQSNFLDTAGLYILNDADILSIDLVFTDYPATLDLKPLNKRRLEELSKLIPFAVNKPGIRWAVIRQMNGDTKENARDMVHGFVINYRKKTSAYETKRELDYLRSSTPPKPAAKNEKPAPKIRHWEYKYRPPTTFAPTEGSEFTPLPYNPPVIRDSVVMKALKRNQFRDMLVVADVTASMSKYSVQVLLWLQAQADSNRIKWLFCFNDGDNKRDSEKRPGMAGGIYGKAFTSIYEASGLMQYTMLKGMGGDLPENDCEALIAAINTAEDYEDVVLIADGWAPVRDIQLVGNIKKPVHVIVCGDNLGPHPDYVTIALKTGGSLHFIKDDVTDLTPLNGGHEMQIRGRHYKLDNDRVTEVKK